MEEDPGEQGLNTCLPALFTCLPALPVGVAVILFSLSAELKKRVLWGTKHQMLQVCGGGFGPIP